ncbi:tyrosine-protein phosphatase [Chryseobacterium camelliae]|uniref:Tyrosine-protein phosphatase n=1 Tax=Chryseobacterium camelliae TaxID=1265445 RepID=A0ABY7QNZ6_9FLAO|nr:tyrosine-protein phosphatase [Chryseobacterium camelliae]WBV60928.1 tyrosine-protein phosphatase [Chryseobacterium camelliae]
MKKIILTLAVATLGISVHAQIKDSARRVVKMEGAYNFRDTGGYKTSDGKEVTLGKVFRSDAIDKLSDKDLKTFKDKKIVTVVDFRGVEEAKKAQDRLPANTTYILCPAGSNNLPTAQDMAKFLKDKNFLFDMYGEGGLPYFGERYRTLFVQLLTLKPDEALLFHCTGGRDRTGMASALFLNILGVPQDVIESDYVASNFYLAKNPTMQGMYSGLSKMSGLTQAEIKQQMELRPELIRNFFAAINKKYGSVENFFQVEMGMGQREIAVLKQKYLK